MKTINVRSPEGNVFVILGCADKFQKQFKDAGIPTGNRDLAHVLENFSTMTYDEILDRLEASELFKFTHRDKKRKSQPK